MSASVTGMAFTVRPWPELMSRSTAAEYCDGDAAFRFLVERGLNPVVSNGARTERWSKTEIDKFIGRVRMDSGESLTYSPAGSDD